MISLQTTGEKIDARAENSRVLSRTKLQRTRRPGRRCGLPSELPPAQPVGQVGAWQPVRGDTPLKFHARLRRWGYPARRGTPPIPRLGISGGGVGWVKRSATHRLDACLVKLHLGKTHGPRLKDCRGDELGLYHCKKLHSLSNRVRESDVVARTQLRITPARMFPCRGVWGPA